MLLACLIVASVGLCLGDQEEVVDERLALLEKKMMGLEEENKYLRLVCSYKSVWYLSCLSIRTKSMKTCEDLKNSPYNVTGVYTMDPDGSGQPVEVFCDVEKGVTEVRSHLCMTSWRGSRIWTPDIFLISGIHRLDMTILLRRM